MLNTILAADRKRVTCGATTAIKKNQAPDKRPTPPPFEVIAQNSNHLSWAV